MDWWQAAGLVLAIFAGLATLVFTLVKLIYSGLEKKIDGIETRLTGLASAHQGKIDGVETRLETLTSTQQVLLNLNEQVGEVKGQVRGLTENYQVTRERIHDVANKLAGNYVTRIENERMFDTMRKENERSFTAVFTKIDRMEGKIDRLIENQRGPE